MPLDEGERIDAARDRRDAIKAWSFILLLLALTLGALRLFWRGYSWLLFSQSTVVFIGALLYIVLFIIFCEHRRTHVVLSFLSSPNCVYGYSQS